MPGRGPKERNSQAVGYAQNHKPTIWERLGFGLAIEPFPPEWEHDSRPALRHWSFTRLNGYDRLRVLLTGEIAVCTVIRRAGFWDGQNQESRSRPSFPAPKVVSQILVRAKFRDRL